MAGTDASARMEAARRAGRLYLDSTALSFADLVRAVARSRGCSSVKEPRDETLATEVVGEPETLILVITDGMGMDILSRLPESSFLRSHLLRELRAVFPSTTACAMTTLATAEWPAVHGMPGWWAFLDEHNLTATTLPFVERYAGTPLGERGVDAADLWPYPAWSAEVVADTVAVLPDQLSGTVFSSYQAGGAEQRPYQRLDEMPAHVLRAAAEPQVRMVGVYLPELDATCHQYGVASAEATAMLQVFEQLLAGVAASLPAGARLVITADHGFVDVAAAGRRLLRPRDRLLDLLAVPPTGEGRVPQFHVRPGREAAFVAEFGERFGAEFILLTQAEAEELALFGPEPLSPLARRRFGTHCAIPLGDLMLVYVPADQDPATLPRGMHAGPDPREMRIPVIAAGDAD